MEYPEIKAVLKDIEKHQEDLHLLFTNDVSSMDLTLYNAVTLALINAQASIQQAIADHDLKLKQFAAQQEKQGGKK